MRALSRRGVAKGDAIALLCPNRPEFAVAYAAALRGGLRLTCINWHLQRDEIAYIVDNCEARAFLADARFADAAAEVARESGKASVRLAIAGPIEGFESFEAALDAALRRAIGHAHDAEDPRL